MLSHQLPNARQPFPNRCDTASLATVRRLCRVACHSRNTPGIKFMGAMPYQGSVRAESVNLVTTKRKVFARLSIPAGNSLQTAGILAACFALRASRSAHSPAMSVIAMLVAWVLLYFSSHAIAHWLVGRMVGIRFLFY